MWGVRIVGVLPGIGCDRRPGVVEFGASGRVMRWLSREQAANNEAADALSRAPSGVRAPSLAVGGCWMAAWLL